MKKLLLILLSICLLQSCSIGTSSDKAPREGETVVSITESSDNKSCIYNTCSGDVKRLFYARKGLYNIGDTIKFTK